MRAIDRRFLQLDVFASHPLRGNPLAVVVDGEGLDVDTMQRFAAWTNLSETSFLLPPDDPQADYRVRIFTPDHEMAFAGHPTLGSCMAWLHSGGVPMQPGLVRQSCPVGIVDIDVSTARPAFVAPATDIAALDPAQTQRIVDGLGLSATGVLTALRLNNGPDWSVLELDSSAALLAIDRSRALHLDVDTMAIGLIASQDRRGDSDYEVRMFSRGLGGNIEDPITGSLNAAIACWLQREGRLQAGSTVTVAQGSCLDRQGRVYLQAGAGDDSPILIGGDVHVVIEGTVRL